MILGGLALYLGVKLSPQSGNPAYDSNQYSALKDAGRVRGRGRVRDPLLQTRYLSVFSHISFFFSWNQSLHLDHYPALILHKVPFFIFIFHVCIPSFFSHHAHHWSISAKEFSSFFLKKDFDGPPPLESFLMTMTWGERTLRRTGTAPPSPAAAPISAAKRSLSKLSRKHSNGSVQ